MTLPLTIGSVSPGTNGIVPNAPSSLTVTISSTESTTIVLTWVDNSNDESNFLIYEKVGQGSFDVINSMPSNSTSFTGYGRTPGTTYEYKVRAITEDNVVSDFSNTVSITIPSNTPVAPTSLVGTPSSSSQVALSWSYPSGATTSNFEVYRDNILLVTINGTLTSYTDGGLTASTSYSYKVRAKNTILGVDYYSGYTNTVSVTTSAPAAPTPPTNISNYTASQNAVNVVKLTWSYSGPSASQTSFVVTRSTTSGGTYTQIGTVAVTQGEFLDTTVTQNTDYFYKGYTTNTGGSFNYPSYITILTWANPPPAPTGLAAGVITSTSISLGWTGTAKCLGYKVRRAIAVDFSSYDEFNVTPPDTTNNYLDAGLTPNTKYYYRVFAYNGVNNSASIDLSGGATTLPGSTPSNDTVISNLFTNNKKGVWLDFSDKQTMFKDVLGKEPVTMAGQDEPIELILDKSRGLTPGPQLVQNNEFTNTSFWTILNSTSTTIINQKLKISGSFSSYTPTAVATQRLNVEPIKKNTCYKITVTIPEYVSGEIFFYFWNGSSYQVNQDSVSSGRFNSSGTISVYMFTGSLITATAYFLYVMVVGSTDLSIDSISIQEIPGNHVCWQSTFPVLIPTSASTGVPGEKPVLSARYNLLKNTANFTTAQTVTIQGFNAEYTLRFTGTGSVVVSYTISGTPYTNTYTQGGPYTIKVNTSTKPILTFTPTGTVTNIDFREKLNSNSTIPSYQEVTSGESYNITGFPYYLKFNGKSFLTTFPNTFNFSAYSLNTWYGTRKNFTASMNYNWYNFSESIIKIQAYTGALEQVTYFENYEEGNYSFLVDSGWYFTVRSLYQTPTRSLPMNDVVNTEWVTPPTTPPLLYVNNVTQSMSPVYADTNIPPITSSDFLFIGADWYGRDTISRSYSQFQYFGKVYSIIVVEGTTTAGTKTDVFSWINLKMGVVG